MTLSDYAEEWARGKGLEVPNRGTYAWFGMYEAWHDSVVAYDAACEAAESECIEDVEVLPSGDKE